LTWWRAENPSPLHKIRRWTNATNKLCRVISKYQI